MTLKKQTSAGRPGLAATLIVCLSQLVLLPATVLAQTQPIISQSQATTTTVTTTSTPSAKPATQTTSTTVVKKQSGHLKRRKGKKARRSHVKTNTAVPTRTNSALTGGVAKSHKHRAHGSNEKMGSAQQIRSSKLNAFLKNPPKMKKAPYFNPPGLDVPSGAL